jgi:hypothetical protein
MNRKFDFKVKYQRNVRPIAAAHIPLRNVHRIFIFSSGIITLQFVFTSLSLLYFNLFHNTAQKQCQKQQNTVNNTMHFNTVTP